MSVGGKASGLRRLELLARVPRFTVFEAPWIEARAADLDARITADVRAHDLHPPFAVRSSASDEDGNDLAFAGMYETVLPVSWVGLTEAVRTVWASGSSERVKAYRAAAGRDDRSQEGVSVIVQELVDAVTAGVAFTRAPWDGRLGAIEAVEGLGGVLVDGGATPERYEFDRDTAALVGYQRGRQYLALAVDGSSRRLTGRQVSARRLNAKVAADLAVAVMKVEQSWSYCPNGLDIEWCLDRAGDLFLLQCRPITSQAVSTAAPESR